MKTSRSVTRIVRLLLVVVTGIVSMATGRAADERPIQALLVTGGCCHDYDRQKLILTRGISARANVRWTVVHQGGTTTDTPIPLYNDPDWAAGFDVVVHNECFSDVRDPDFVDRILAPHRAGMPAILIHCAMHCYRVGDDRWFEFVGLESPGHGPHYSYTADNVQPDHPIMRDFGPTFVAPKGELYHAVRVFDTATPLARANRQEDGLPQVCIWTNDYRGTRVFGCTMGHYNETMAEPKYLDMMARAVLWSVGRDSDQEFAASTLATDEAIQALVTAPPEPVPDPGPDQSSQQCCVDGNLLHAKLVSATSEETAKNNLVAHAVDGRLETRWCASGLRADESITVDLEQPETIRTLRIYWEASQAAYRYTVEASQNGTDWQTVIDRSDNTERNGVATDRLDDVHARYLRITYRGSDTGAWASTRELVASDTDLPPAVPASPEQSTLPGTRADVGVPDGFRATIFAGPPTVNYPVCVTASASGEVFVGVDDQGSLGKESGRGKVLRCIDTDGDGVADRINEFVRVDHPRGLIHDNGSLWVLHPPFLSVFHDSDGDGDADRSKVLISGISTDLVDKRGADHTTNGIRMGIDGWIYIAVGDFGFHQAEAKDGTTLSRRGGGIVRIRPDGTEMEIFAWGLRNIVDVAIDPRMNVFTRDNTNDGGGWDVRLSHILPTADYGYPSLFRNFTSETMPPLADYGGGSGCGALWFQDSRWPADFNNVLLTCDWGRNEVYSHRLPENGPTFDAHQATFLTIPRPTDIDVDGAGRMYVSSWKNGQFRYDGPHVGFVAQVLPSGFVPHPAPRIPDLTSRKLVNALQHPSAVVRLAVQRELLRRIRRSTEQLSGIGELRSLEARLTDLAEDANVPMFARVASIWTLKQGLGTDANLRLSELSRDASLREHCLRAIADRRTEIARLDFSLFTHALSDPNPRVRAAAIVGASRIVRGVHQRAPDFDLQGAAVDVGTGLWPLTVRMEEPPEFSGEPWRQPDPGRVLPHLAVQAFVDMHAIEACRLALNPMADERPYQETALLILSRLHDPRTVDELLSLLHVTRDEAFRRRIWSTLIRLYYREGEFTPDSPGWWGTRPDTTGPLYDRQTWSESERIADAARTALTEADPEFAAFLREELDRFSVSLDGISSVSAEPGESEAAFVLPAADPDNPHQIGNLDPEQVVIRAMRETGEIEAGRRLFAQQSCGSCHTVAAGQQPRGPHLVDIGKRYNKQELLESILQPSKKIAQGFDSWLFVMKSGRVETGFVTLESAETVTLRGIDGRSRDILREDIEERIRQEVSMMPKGVVDNLTPEQLTDLVAWLQTLK